MANVKTTQVWIQDSIDLFINHWKYWHNYEDSTVLISPQKDIIAFYDRGTENIDVIQADLPHPWGFIIMDAVWYDVEWLVKYEPYDYEMARYKWKNLVSEYKKEKKSIVWLWEDMSQELKEYNINYFNNVKNTILAIGGKSVTDNS